MTKAEEAFKAWLSSLPFPMSSTHMAQLELAFDAGRASITDQLIVLAEGLEGEAADHQETAEEAPEKGLHATAMSFLGSAFALIDAAARVRAIVEEGK